MADSTHNHESTSTTPSPEQMYCHACHHEWQRQGESLECPACNSETTEIVSNQTPPTTSIDTRTTTLTQDRQISPDNDPRHFHRRPMPVTVEDAPEEEEPQPNRSAATETEAQQATEASTSNTEVPSANENNEHDDARPQTESNGTSATSGTTQTSDEANARGTQEQNSNSSTHNEPPRSESRSTNTQHFDIRFIFPPVTFFTTVISEPAAPQSQQQPAGSQPNGQTQSSQQSNEQPNNQQSNASNTSTNGPTPTGFTPSGPSPVTFFGLHFFTPRPPHVHTAPAPTSMTNTTQTEGTAQQQQQPNGEQPQAAEQQQPQQGPQPATQGQEHPIGPGAMPAGLVNALLSAIFNPFNPLVLGNLNFVNDGVYSQEAFDRIITQLREQHAAQNPGGAPPASQAAIEKLRVKDIDEQMLQGCQDNKTKCVICVDDMVLGDKATLLPCDHFFHGECVTPWLKVHNTCPVCRRSVEVEEAPESKKRKNMAEHEPTGRDGHGIDEAPEDEDGQQSATAATPAIPERQRRPYGPERLRGEGTDCA